MFIYNLSLRPYLTTGESDIASSLSDESDETTSLNYGLFTFDNSFIYLFLSRLLLSFSLLRGTRTRDLNIFFLLRLFLLLCHFGLYKSKVFFYLAYASNFQNCRSTRYFRYILRRIRRVRGINWEGNLFHFNLREILGIIWFYIFLFILIHWINLFNRRMW